MRNMSFMLTTNQVRRRTKHVTRRLGWKDLTPGTLLCAVEKSQGLGKGGKINRLCTIRVVDVRPEQLRAMDDDLDYGVDECSREGFPELTPRQFIEFFCASHRGCAPETPVTRIAFEYVEES